MTYRTNRRTKKRFKVKRKEVPYLEVAGPGTLPRYLSGRKELAERFGRKAIEEDRNSFGYLLVSKARRHEDKKTRELERKRIKRERKYEKTNPYHFDFLFEDEVGQFI